MDNIADYNSYISFLKEQSVFYNKLAGDTNFLYEEINNLKNTEQLNDVIAVYKEQSGPTNIVRLTVLKAIEQGKIISDDFVNEVKEKFLNKDLKYFEQFLDSKTIEHINSCKSLNPFKTWGDPFKMFYVYFFNGKSKNKTITYMNAIGQSLLNELNLNKEYTIKIVDFGGVRNQGRVDVWIALYPKRLKNYANAVQIFCDITKDSLVAGIYKGDNVKNNLNIDENYRKEYSTYDEMLAGLKNVVEEAVKLNSLIDENEINGPHYWIYAAGEQSKYWNEFYNSGIMAIGWDELGNLANYPTQKSIKEKLVQLFPNSSNNNNVLANWEFANVIKPGDVIFVKKGINTIVGRGVVAGDYTYDDSRATYKSTRKVDWTHNGEWNTQNDIVKKTLTDITRSTEDVNELENLFDLTVEDKVEYTQYTEEDFLNDVFIEEEQYDILKNLLLKKKNLILQGAPGVGKTYTAKRLAYSIIGKMDTDKVKMIQFHQSYGYEDFIMGYRPKNDGFELSYGPFYNFCNKAEKDPENDYFFIIDEINRGKLSKIFGELLMLIETDKRGSSLQLLYKDEQFSVPSNVYIIGMMNTADRSLAMMDYALRRRFAFYEFAPAFDCDKFKQYVGNKANDKFQTLISKIVKLNNEISNDESLGDGFRIGHSYFCTEDSIASDEWLDSVIDYEIAPLLNEYWFDEKQKANNWIQELKAVLK